MSATGPSDPNSHTAPASATGSASPSVGGEAAHDHGGGELNAAALAAAGAGLLDHLRRSGVRMVPAGDPAAQAAWQARMVVPDAPTAVMPPAPAATAAANPRPRASKPTVAPSLQAAAQSRLAAVPAVTVIDSPYPGTSLPVAERQRQLDGLAEAVSTCVRCDELARCRTQTVFGEGRANARFVFFGEGPGAEEDRTGRPFVGPAGQLLTKMIEACRLQREDVYILNAVKCRPPDNRNPTDEEVEHCRGYFEQQLAWIRPEYIICLGAVSSKALLRTKLSIGRLRQQFHQYHDSKVLVMYHPAYLLRNPDAKKAAWADLQLLMADAGL